MGIFIIAMRIANHHSCGGYHPNPAANILQAFFIGIVLLIFFGALSIIYLRWRQNRARFFKEQLFIHSLAHPSYQAESSTALMQAITNFKINQISYAKRCEICHQIDLYDPVNDYCARCAESSIINVIVPEQKIIISPRFNPQLQLNRRLLFTFLLSNIVGSTMLGPIISIVYMGVPLPWFYGFVTGLLLWLCCWFFFHALDHLGINGLVDRLELYCFKTRLEIRGNETIKIDLNEVIEIRVRSNWRQRRLNLGTIMIKLTTYPNRHSKIYISDIERAEEVQQYLMVLLQRVRVMGR